MSDQQDCQRLDWESAELHPGVAGGFFLVVRGTAPTAMEVELRSLPIPIAPEDYHGVEVCGRSNGPVAQARRGKPKRRPRDGAAASASS
jgi:hypothetical protein